MILEGPVEFKFTMYTFQGCFDACRSFAFQNSINSLIIRQKDESQKRCYKKTKHAKFSKNEHFLPPDKQWVSGGNKWSFSNYS